MLPKSVLIEAPRSQQFPRPARPQRSHEAGGGRAGRGGRAAAARRQRGVLVAPPYTNTFHQ